MDEETRQRIANLKLEYKDVPQPELLIAIPNQSLGTNYTVHTTTDEFSSLCPLNMAQPDYARIDIEYSPNLWLVELKSLKFMFTSFRLVPIFHEQVPSMILEYLVKLLLPRRIVVKGVFTVRGGISTTVTAYYEEREVA